MSTTSDSLRALGTESFRNGDFQKAIQYYTESIELDDSSYLSYSNRALAYLKEKNYKLAIEDCDQAISILPRFGKAYSTKGAALEGLGQFAEALQVYKLGVANADPKSAVLEDNLKRLENRNNRPSSSASPPIASNLTGKNLKIVSSAVFFSFVLSLIPFNPYSSKLYMITLIGIIINGLGRILANHGMPQANEMYVSRIMQDNSLPFFSVVMILMMAPFSYLGLFSVGALEAYLGFLDFCSLFPQLQSLVAGFLAMESPKFLNLTKFAQRVDLLGGPISSKQVLSEHPATKSLGTRLASLSCIGLVLLAISFVLQIPTSSRNLMGSFMIYQALKTQYVVSPRMKAAFGFVDDRIQGLLAFGPIPPIIRTGYAKLSHFLKGQADSMLQQAQERGRNGPAGANPTGIGALAQKCSVM